MDEPPHTVVELPEFVAFAERNLTEEERAAIIVHLALHPQDGDLIKGTGGLRKIRWAAKGKGKSGGVRIIHYYYSDDIPIFIITGFAKNKMENISPAARNIYRKLLPQIVNAYKESRHGRKKIEQH
jgi:hypothetical protein